MFCFGFFLKKDLIAEKHCYTLPQCNSSDQFSACFAPQALWESWDQRSVLLSPFSLHPLFQLRSSHTTMDFRAHISLFPPPHLSPTLCRVIAFVIGKIIKGKATSHTSCSFAKLFALFRDVILSQCLNDWCGIIPSSLRHHIMVTARQSNPVLQWSQAMFLSCNPLFPACVFPLGLCHQAA